jgi:dihydropteroate synthase
LAAGAEIINDITALAGDPEMLPLAVASRSGVCIMHMQGTPQTMQDAPHYDDVVAEVFTWLAARRDKCLAAGVEPQRLALDPGIGFGKTHGHNLKLLAGAWRFHALGCPLVVGHSRKGYIGKVLGDKLADRTAGTIGVSISLALQGVQILRVHDVLAVRQALELFAACGGLSGQALELP